MAEYAVYGKAGSGAAPPSGASVAVEEVLRSSSLFLQIDANLMAKIAGYFETKSYSAGATIVRAGAPAVTLGILARGKANLTAVNAVTGEQRIIEELQVGDPYGDVGVLLEAAHQDSVVAQTACAVIEISKELFGQLCAKIPGVSHAISKRLAMRLVKQNLMGIRAPATAAPPVEAPGTPARGAKSTGDLIPFVFVSDYNPSDQLLNMVPITVMHEHQCLPLLLRDRTLTVGLVNPRNPAAISSIRRLLQHVDVQIVAISSDDLSSWIARLKPTAGASRPRQRPGVSADSLTFDVEDAERDAEKELRVIGDEVVRLANRIIAEGIAKEVSDIHIEADRASVRVRFRRNGNLTDYPELVPSSFAKSLVARIKVLAGLDISERRLPQDGRLGVVVGGREIDLRVSTIPAVRGEKVVMRLHDAASMLRPLDQAFLDAHVLDVVRRALTANGGAIVVGGGTGSGKSSSLYSMLADRMKARTDNVLMVEDPIEFRLPGTTQVQVNAGIGLGFAAVLRAALRQDPDVIVVGETRDPETARMATEAAISGHLLMTSIHATDCLSVIQRLEGLGCSRALIAQACSAILVQRLAPKLCRACVRTEVPPPAMLANLAKFGLAEAATPQPMPISVGCEACEGTGYVGRVAVVEALEVDEQLQSALMADRTLDAFRTLAIESRKLHLFRQSAAFLMTRKVLSATDALLTCAH